MLKKVSIVFAVLLLSAVVAIGILYKVRSLPNYQSWPHRTETKFFGYFFTEYKYDDSYNWVAEQRKKKKERPKEITWHRVVKGENDIIVYFTESTYKPVMGFYFQTEVYERKYLGKCEDWNDRKASCFQYSKYASVLGIYFTVQSSKEYHLE